MGNTPSTGYCEPVFESARPKLAWLCFLIAAIPLIIFVVGILLVVPSSALHNFQQRCRKKLALIDLKPTWSLKSTGDGVEITRV